MFITSENSLKFSVMKDKAGGQMPVHWHEEVEVTYVTKGAITVIIDGKALDVKEGHAVLSGSGSRHFKLQREDSDGITINFSMELLDGTEGAGSVKADITERLEANAKSTAAWTEENRRRAVDLIRELSTLDPSYFGYELKVRSDIFQLLLLFADPEVNPPSEEEEAAEESETGKKVYDRLEKVFLYISENYNKDITLTSTAEFAGYVPTYFSRVFKDYTGMTFYDYLTSYRLSMAIRALLSEDKKSMAEIAEESGFGSVKTFDRVFKARMDISPLKFRKNHTSSK